MAQMTPSRWPLPAGLPRPARSWDVWEVSFVVEGRGLGEVTSVDAQQVGGIRSILAFRLGMFGLSALKDTVLVIVSEIVTNAVEHVGGLGGGSVTFVQQLSSSLRFEVTDSGRGRPQPRNPGPDDERGRGLTLVNALTDELGGTWGFDPDKRTLWVDLPITPPLS
ncbi:ATP-binding protein [Streptomyces lavendulae]|uniref:ATP-binding protein n=1 Tax=Streptomyces lavendulae TaxID=1914 RepID=UPI00069174A0|nr:ATP-binding protein [Streptomyces lavendulae]GLW03645.1 hypothetical protein Slala05_72750 [Streptomyces lavendulae subsp. lavendulae]